MSDSKTWPVCKRCGKTFPPEMVAHTCKPKVPAGYTEEELERDNPFNAWLHEGVGSSEAGTEPD